jgi:site-specific recombinase XerC
MRRSSRRGNARRHVAGTRTLRVSGNLAAAQKLLEHSRISTTMKYAHFLLDELKTIMEEAHRAPAATEMITVLPIKKTAEQS